MIVTQKVKGNLVTLSIKGSINKLDIPALRSWVGDMAETPRLLIDLTHVDFIDSGFVNLLVEVKKRFPRAAENLVLKNPKETVMEILHITGVGPLFRIETDSAALV